MGRWVRAHRGRPSRVAGGFVVAAVALLACGVTGALADTTIGEQNLVPNMGSGDLLGQNVPVFQGDAGGGYVLSASQAGKITSWKFLSGGIATGKRFELAVLAPTDSSGTGWRLLATSAPVAVSTPTGTDAVNGPFPVSIPIDVGQRIALMPLDDSYTPIETGTQGVDGIRYFSQPFAGGLGSSQQVAPGSTADNGQVVPIQATIGSGGSTPAITAKLTLRPSPTCTGIATTFDAAGSVSPDGIKTYSFSIIDLYAANVATLAKLGRRQPDTEYGEEGGIDFMALDLMQAPGVVDPFTGNDAQQVESFAGPPMVSEQQSISYTFDWNRIAIYNPNDNIRPAPPPGTMVRDPVGVLLVVTDSAGHSARAVAVLKFAQHFSSDSRANCPKTRRLSPTPDAALSGLVFPNYSRKPLVGVSCLTGVPCLGSITVTQGGHISRAIDAAHRPSLVLATGFFKIPAHRKGKVTLTLTKLGKSRLHRGARVPVRITVMSVSPTGRTRTHVYSQVLTR